MLPWVILVLAVAVVLTIGIERLLARLDIRPADPESAKGGVRVVAEQLEEWASKRTDRREQ